MRTTCNLCGREPCARMVPCVLAERERQRLYAAANGLPDPSKGWKARRDERKSEKHRNDRALAAERDALAEHLGTSEKWRMDSARRPAPGLGVARLQHLVDATADTIGAKVVLTRAEALALLAEVMPAPDRAEEP